jgi:hypothetical protein
MSPGRTLLLTACLTGLCGGAVRVLSPNGGESFSAKSTQLITWQCDTSTTQAVIEFSYTDGVLWETVAPAARPPIVAACHDLLLSGQTSFLLNYRDATGRAPVSVQVVLAGTPYDMTLDLGSAAAGTYRVDVPRAANCREYYFFATTAGGESWRYPGPGVFLTDGESNCGTDYR